MTKQHISFEKTGYFSKLVIDYLNESANLNGLYKYAPSAEEIKKAIGDRKQFPVNRTLLVQQLQYSYDAIAITDKQKENITLLQKEQVFTVTTAHQPNIFTGPLYFIYKIIYAIKMADELNEKFPDNHFVPVYYIGSEDADLDELNHIYLKEEKIVWNTPQTGAVGRMRVDESLIQIIEKIYGQLGVYPFGEELKQLFLKAYQKSSTIAEATFVLVNQLFGEYGLVVINPDNTAYKRSFIPIIEKEIKEQFSLAALQPAKEVLEQHYKVQANGRDINLFYLTDDKRDRIELQNHPDKPATYKIHNTNLHFTLEELLLHVNTYPERFSPNVITRGLLQETILPNIAYIGGGGELAYWLELKAVFAEANVFFPQLLLRNSFMVYYQHQEDLMNKLDVSLEDIFLPLDGLLNNYVKAHAKDDYTLVNELKEIDVFYNTLIAKTSAQDISLSQHVVALKKKHADKLFQLEKKLFKSQKRKFIDTAAQMDKLKHQLFPNNQLQERIYNFSVCYSKQGRGFLSMMYNATEVFGKEFILIKGEQ